MQSSPAVSTSDSLSSPKWVGLSYKRETSQLRNSPCLTLVQPIYGSGRRCVARSRKPQFSANPTTCATRDLRNIAQRTGRYFTALDSTIDRVYENERHLHAPVAVLGAHFQEIPSRTSQAIGASRSRNPTEAPADDEIETASRQKQQRLARAVQPCCCGHSSRFKVAFGTPI